MPATFAQLDELLQLDVQCFGAVAWDAQAWVEVVGDPAWTTLVWCRDGRLCGAMVLLLAQPETSLASLAIHPSSRGLGAGRAFVREALLRARGTGARWISLEVDRGNSAALSLYRSSGFGVCRRFMEDGRQRMEMRRRLRPARPRRPEG